MNPWLLDAFVILAYFVAVIGIGLYKGRGSNDMEAFAVGDRNIPWWAVLASIIAAETSAATFLGAPGEGFEHRNFLYAQMAIGTVLARIIIAYLFIKPYYDYRVVSIYEFVRIRFGERTKNWASAIFLFTRALASGTRLYVAAIILVIAYQAITGRTLTIQQQLLTYAAALTFLTVATAIYTTLGGIKAVVWTDVIQACVMFGGLGFAIWALLDSVPGGLGGALATLKGPKDLAFFDWGINPSRSFLGNLRLNLESEYTIWTALFGGIFLTMATHGTDQDMVQRMLTATDYHKSRRALILSGLADIPLVLCFLFVGVLLWVHYGGAMKEQPFAHYIVYEMPTGLRGLLMAGVFATAMGSLSTALNALATSFTKDWYTPYIRPDATPREVVSAARWSTLGFSLLLIVIGVLTAYAVLILESRIIPIVLGIFGYTYGSLLGVFLVGMVTKRRGNETGNVIAMLAGFFVVFFVSDLHNDLWRLLMGNEYAVLWKPRWLPAVAFPWRITIGTVVTFFVALLFPTPWGQVRVAEEHIRARSAHSEEGSHGM